MTVNYCAVKKCAIRMELDGTELLGIITDHPFQEVSAFLSLGLEPP
jgi:hypothetical protein